MNTLLTLLIAAVPLRWAVETSKVQPAQFEVVHGESIALEATLQSGGKPLDLTGSTAYLYWQTNGMNQAWWSSSATVSSNKLSAVFLPEMDPGAAAVTGFIGIPGENYRAAFQLRFRHGPGAVPNEIEPPVRMIDFSRVNVANAPWATPDDVDNEAQARADADDALADRIEELTGGAVTESDIREIVAEMGAEFGKVQSVNGKTGTVVLVASDIGAVTLPDVLTEVGDAHRDLESKIGIEEARAKQDILEVTALISAEASRAVNAEMTIVGSVAGKADQSDVTSLGQQVGAIAAHLNAEDAKAVVTNYDSAVHMPEASLQVKVEGEWLKVWDEMTRWNWFLGTFETFSNNVYQALSTKGEKEWGWFNSATGDASPDGLLQLAQPRIQICSGAAYQRYGDTAASYWVLESNGMVANINGTTNGFFRVSDEEGNTQFEIIKGDKQTVFATAKTMTSEVIGVRHYFTDYAVTNAVSNPVAEFTTSLTNINWIAETDPSCPFNTRWTLKSNNIYEIEWWPKGTQPQAFMKCGYMRGGETYIKNSVPVSMEYLMLNGVKYRLGKATIDGNVVLTLTQE